MSNEDVNRNDPDRTGNADRTSSDKGVKIEHEGVQKAGVTGGRVDPRASDTAPRTAQPGSPVSTTGIEGIKLKPTGSTSLPSGQQFQESSSSITSGAVSDDALPSKLSGGSSQPRARLLVESPSRRVNFLYIIVLLIGVVIGATLANLYLSSNIANAIMGNDIALQGRLIEAAIDLRADGNYEAAIVLLEICRAIAPESERGREASRLLEVLVPSSLSNTQPTQIPTVEPSAVSATLVENSTATITANPEATLDPVSTLGGN